MAIGHAHDEIRIRTSANANQLDLLAAEGMVRMNDGYESQRRLGKRGSVL